MNRCPNCAAQNRDGAKFCTSCGFRMPSAEAKAAEPVASTRQPFATTATVARHDDPVVASEPMTAETATATDATDPAYANWTTPISGSVIEDGPGGSWEAPPPRDTAVPVSDEMIASLLDDAKRNAEAKADESDDSASAESSDEPVTASNSDAESSDEDAEGATESADPESVAEAPEVESDESVIELPAHSSSENEGTATASVDSLLKLVRELEYGLMELGDPAPTANGSGSADVDLLQGALDGLTDEDDISALRAAIATAQDRPRDVDVMLDLVLRADAIASIIAERDQLKSAIELALRNTNAN